MPNYSVIPSEVEESLEVNPEMSPAFA